MDEFITDGYFWQGRAVRLRPFRPDDWAMKYQESLDTEARRFLEYEAELPHTPQDYRERFAGENPVKDERNRLSFAIEALSGEFAGWVKLHSRDDRNGTFSCAVGIFAPYRKRGFAEEAMRIVLRYAFRELRLQKCNTSCLYSNEASVRLQKRLGFVQEGLRRRTVFMMAGFMTSGSAA